jgi:hypothetical protein
VYITNNHIDGVMVYVLVSIAVDRGLEPRSSQSKVHEIGIYCFFDIRILIIRLVSFGHCVVSSSSIYWFWLPLWYLVAIVLSVLLRYTDSDYPFGICWPLCCQFLFDIRILITPLVSFGHCVVSSSSIYWIWLPLRYHLAIVLSRISKKNWQHNGQKIPKG